MASLALGGGREASPGCLLKLCPRQSKSRIDFKADNRNTNHSSPCLRQWLKRRAVEAWWVTGACCLPSVPRFLCLKGPTVRSGQCLAACVWVYSALGGSVETTEGRWSGLRAGSPRPSPSTGPPAWAQWVSWGLAVLGLHGASRLLCRGLLPNPWHLSPGEKPFSCSHCNRAFADRSNLRAHLQTHSDVKKYQCQACARTFSRMSLLHKHQESGCSGGPR